MQIASIEMLDDETLLVRAASHSENSSLLEKLLVDNTKSGINLQARNISGRHHNASGTSNRKQNFVLFIGQRIVGMTSVEPEPNAPTTLSVTTVTVEEVGRWGPIHGRALLEAAYQYAFAQKMTLEPGHLTPKGIRVFQRTFAELAQKYSQSSASITN
jgi:hypothetical protein